jgi:hypothetical protein
MKREAASPPGALINCLVVGQHCIIGTWALRLGEIRTGPRQTVGCITALPLLVRGERSERRLLPVSLALRSGTLSVEECPSATVGRLVVRNQDHNSSVLGIGGEMLLGGLQDRVVNGSFIVGPRQTVEVPVSCVEQHRWSGRSTFRSAETLATSQVRSQLHESVHTCVTRVSRVRSSEQGSVWHTVDRTCHSARATSSSGSLRHVYEKDERRVREQCGRFTLLPDQSGLALFFGEELVSVDLFGTPQLLGHYQPRLLGAVLADPRAKQQDTSFNPEERVSEIFGQIAGAHAWAALPLNVGCEEIRPSVVGFAVSALVWQGVLEHLQVHPSGEPPAVWVAPRARGSDLELSVQIKEGVAFRVFLGRSAQTIGRSSRCDLCIEEPSVSRRHAALCCTDRGILVRDLGSTNGIEVNGKQAKEAEVRVGDHLSLGGHVQLQLLRIGGTER